MRKLPNSAEDDPQARKDQRDRFIETARQLGCDEDEAAFREKLGKLAKAKPTGEDPKSGK